MPAPDDATCALQDGPGGTNATLVVTMVANPAMVSAGSTLGAQYPLVVTDVLGVTDLSGVAQFARGPLSPAETGHYNYGKHYPGINTDASGSYHREEVVPHPQKYVGESSIINSTDLPIEPRDTGSI